MDCSRCVTRRRFLEVSSTSIIGALLTSCGQQPLSSGGGASATVYTDENNVATLAFSDYPSLQTVGGSVHLSIQAKSGAKDVYVTRTSSTVVNVLSTVCTHAQCTLDAYKSSTQKYVCQCHGSTFNSDGTVSVGPATVALTSYAAILSSKGTGIEVTVN